MKLEAIDKALLQRARLDRVRCPCCKRWCRIYKTKFHSGMARALIKLYHLGIQSTDGWIYLRRTDRSHLYNKLLAWNMTKLPCWGLTRSELLQHDKVPKGTCRRRWQLTPLGHRFVLGLASVPRHMLIPTGMLNEVFEPFDKNETTTITAALGDHFDYSELMRG